MQWAPRGFAHAHGVRLIITRCTRGATSRAWHGQHEATRAHGIGSATRHGSWRRRTSLRFLKRCFTATRRGGNFLLVAPVRGVRTNSSTWREQQARRVIRGPSQGHMCAQSNNTYPATVEQHVRRRTTNTGSIRLGNVCIIEHVPGWEPRSDAQKINMPGAVTTSLTRAHPNHSNKLTTGLLLGFAHVPCSARLPCRRDDSTQRTDRTRTHYEQRGNPQETN